MREYKLINTKTNEEHLCEKVTIDGFDYYVSDDEAEIGENVLWIKQTYHGDKEYANYIGKVYALKECFPRGKEIILKDFYPKKSLDEVRQVLITFLKKVGKQKTAEQIEESAIKNQANSGNLHLKIGYNISENDIKKIIATNNPNIDIPKIAKVDDVESRAMELLKDRWSHLYTFGNPKRPFPTNYENDLNNIKLGILESNRDDALSSDDTIDFCNWFCDVFLNKLIGLEGVEEEEKYAHLKGKGANEEVLEIWKEQRAKVVYVQ